MDLITLKRIDLLHPIVRQEVKVMYKLICQALRGRAICRFTRTFSSKLDQDLLYAIGRTISLERRTVTNAKGGESYHNYGLAFDMVLLIDKTGNGKHSSASWETKIDFDGDGIADWMEVVEICKAFGWTWGGDWRMKDSPHFEKSFGLKVEELARIMRDGVVLEGRYPGVGRPLVGGR